jgi:hypothetical protein
LTEPQRQPGNGPVVILACEVMRGLIESQPGARGLPAQYLDFGLHVEPKRMKSALQARLAALPEPSRVLIGYGLCGNGLVGLEAGPHTLVIPRTDDCIAILLGSQQAYLREFREKPGTYYLTKGWLECEGHPLREYREYVERYGRERADHVVDMMYHSYKRLCLVAHTRADLDAYRPRAREVAEFCEQRWGMVYEERLGSDALIVRLLAAASNNEDLGDDFVVIPPGGAIEQEMFLPDR